MLVFGWILLAEVNTDPSAPVTYDKPDQFFIPALLISTGYTSIALLVVHKMQDALHANHNKVSPTVAPTTRTKSVVRNDNKSAQLN